MDEQVTGARKEKSSESLVWEGPPPASPGLCSEGLGLDFSFFYPGIQGRWSGTASWLCSLVRCLLLPSTVHLRSSIKRWEGEQECSSFSKYSQDDEAVNC